VWTSAGEACGRGRGRQSGGCAEGVQGAGAGARGSPLPTSPHHLRSHARATAGSALKMDTGMARSLVGAFSGLRAGHEVTGRGAGSGEAGGGRGRGWVAGAQACGVEAAACGAAPARDDVSAVEALVLDALVAQELRQALGGRDGARLAAGVREGRTGGGRARWVGAAVRSLASPLDSRRRAVKTGPPPSPLVAPALVFVHALGHGGGLADVAQQLRVGQVHSLGGGVKTCAGGPQVSWAVSACVRPGGGCDGAVRPVRLSPPAPPPSPPKPGCRACRASGWRRRRRQRSTRAGCCPPGTAQTPPPGTP
jgi:hypothetical protein